MTALRTVETPDLVQAERVIRGFLASRVDDADDLDDITQLCLIKVWKGWWTFEGRAHWTSWVYRLARNECVSWTRRRASWRRSDTAWLGPQPERDLADAVTDRVSAGRLIHRLSRRNQELVNLLFFHGLTSSEAGERLGAAPSTVRCWWREARRDLRATRA